MIPFKIIVKKIWRKIRMKKYYSLGEKELQISPQFFFSKKDKEEITSLVKEYFSSSCQKTIERADLTCKHIFTVLGSNPTNLGNPVDWHNNFKGGKWPKERSQKLIKRLFLNDFQNPYYKADIKLNWELNKHLHFIDLGKAYWLTKNEKYAKEFVNQVSSWMEANPLNYGVNWTSALLTSHRLISWIFAFFFLVHSPYFTENFSMKFFKFLIYHARYTAQHLEVGEFSSNHLFGNLSGLFLFSFVFPEFKESEKWREQSLQMFIEESERQVYSDGVHYEQSSGYHRYVIEFCLIPIILAYRNSVKLPQKFLSKVEKMLEYVVYLIKPDGLVSPISDADGARAFNFNNSDINDFRSCLSLGAVLFGRSDFKYAGNRNFEEVIWLLGKKGFSEYQKIDTKLPGDTSRDFPDGGYYIMRDSWEQKANYLLFDCGYIGMSSKDKSCGTHGHSDQLNIILYSKGQTFLTDSGSYTYTGSKKWHDYFRGTKGHNTLIVDGQDQCGLTTTWTVKRQAKPLDRLWYTSEDFDYVQGAHDGYQKLGIIHKRQILFIRKEYWIMVDTVKGKGLHNLEFLFHLMPDLKPILNQEDLSYLIRGEKSDLFIVPFLERGKCKAKIEEGWYAPDYGVKVSTPLLKYEAKNIELPTKIITFLCPLEKGEEFPRISLFNPETFADGIRIKSKDKEDIFRVRPTEIPEILFLREAEGKIIKKWTKEKEKFSEL